MQVLKSPPSPQQSRAPAPAPTSPGPRCPNPPFPSPPADHSPLSPPRHAPWRGAPSLTFQGPFGPHFVRTLHIPGFEAPRRRLPFHPRWLPARRRRRRWRHDPATRPGSPETQALAARHSATPGGPGCPAPAPKAGRLDPGPLRPAGPLPSPPRPGAPPPPTRSRLALGPSQAPTRGLGGRGDLTTSPAAPRPGSPPATPPSGPGPGLGCGSRPLPPQEVSVRGQFPRWLAPRPL